MNVLNPSKDRMKLRAPHQKDTMKKSWSIAAWINLNLV